MHIALASFLLTAVMTSAALGVEIVELRWPTERAAPPVRLSKAAEALLPAFRLSLEHLPESATVAFALTQPEILGLSGKQAEELQPLLQTCYSRIAVDPSFGRCGSHLPYCFAEKRPAEGLARLILPADVNAESPVVLFLHGFGGSCLWCQHWLHEQLPGYVLICPAYGVSTAAIPPEYLVECTAAAEKQLGHPLRRPSLVGLSAGGCGGCRVYAKDARRYDRLIVLAAYPPTINARQFTNESRLSFLAGGAESYVLDGTWRGALDACRASGAKVTAETIPEASHFFMLSHPQQTGEWLRGQLAAE